MRLILFDVDGTLLLSGGAGSRALHSALREMYGLQNGMNGIRPHGKTDPQIVREVLLRCGRETDFTDQNLTSLFAIYLGCLRKEVARSTGFEVLPGARELISTLSRKPDLALGLATGNIQDGARVKLDRAGLTSFFSFGGYGSDAENRTELIRIAIERGSRAVHTLSPEKVFMIGDTPHDIVHGKEVGAITVAVATGGYSMETLAGYRPDLLLPGLEPREPVLRFLTA